MGNPVNFEGELLDQSNSAEQGGTLQDESLEGENKDKTLLLKGSPSENSGDVELHSLGRQKLSSSIDGSSGAQDNGSKSIGSTDSEEMEKPLLAKPSEPRDEVSGSPVTRETSLADNQSRVATDEMIKEMEIKYAAYVRHDKYGSWGSNRVSLWEKASLLFAFVFIVPIRVILIFTILITFYVICWICTLFRKPGVEVGQENYGHLTGVRRTVIVYSGRFLSRALLFAFGFYHIKVTHRSPERMQNFGENESNGDSAGLLEGFGKRPGAVISNHVSYIDILYHMSSSFPSFVAKRSVMRLPFVGLMSKCMGCVYVQREAKSSDFRGVSGIVADRLKAAQRDPRAPKLLLFPEGTTTNGDYLLPFKTGAFLAETPVLPVILKYPFRRFSPAWETISGARHLIFLLCQYVNHLEVVNLPVYCPTAKECSDAKLYAQNVRRLVAVEGDLRMSDIGLYEKRVFHSAFLGSVHPLASDSGQECK